jgi:protease-4
MEQILNFFKTIFMPVKALFNFINNYFKVFIIFILIAFVAALSNKSDMSNIETANLYKLHLKGEILDISDIKEEIVELIEADNIKGVLFVVDSPGGFVSESVELSELIRELNKKKPVVTYAYGSLASGSYYASIWSEHIMANKGTVVGSIGVIMDSLNIRELQKTIGIEPQVVKMGKYKEAGTMSREWTKEEREELEKVMQNMYDEFVNDVAVARKLDVTKKDEFAEAHIFTAPQALTVGLIDEVGIELNAEKKLRELAVISGTEAVWAESPDEAEEDFLESLVQSFVKNLVSEFISSNQELKFQ